MKSEPGMLSFHKQEMIANSRLPFRFDMSAATFADGAELNESNGQLSIDIATVTQNKIVSSSRHPEMTGAVRLGLPHSLDSLLKPGGQSVMWQSNTAHATLIERYD